MIDFRDFSSFQSPVLFNTGGGSILNERWIISAKHLLPKGKETYSNDFTSYVFPNIDNTLKIDSIVTGAKPHLVIRKFCLPKKDDEHWIKSDLVLFKLSTPIDLNNSNFRPIPLAKPKIIDSTKNVVLAGWGFTKNGEVERNPTRHLKRTEMLVTRRNNSGKLCISSEQVLCTQRINGLGCVGDSGGPAMVKNKKTQSYELVGVISGVDTRCQ